MWINAFTSSQGILEKQSLHEIVTKRKMDFKTHCKHVFGTYVEAHDDSTVINNMALRTYICISLGLSRNIQGSQKVFGIYTGKVQKLRKLIENSNAKPGITQDECMGSTVKKGGVQKNLVYSIGPNNGFNGIKMKLNMMKV